MATRFEKLKEMTVDEITEWWVDHIDCSGCLLRYGCSTLFNSVIIKKPSVLEECKFNIKRFLTTEVPEEPEVCASCAIDFGEEEVE